TEFVDALTAALGPLEPAAGPGPWLEHDPDLTEPGPQPTASVVQTWTAPTPEPAQLRRRGRRLGVLIATGVLALAVGGAVGYAAQRGLAPTERTVSDDTETLAVTVPVAWDRAD